jgi:hypothetical protein
MEVRWSIVEINVKLNNYLVSYLFVCVVLCLKMFMT